MGQQLERELSLASPQAAAKNCSDMAGRAQLENIKNAAQLLSLSLGVAARPGAADIMLDPLEPAYDKTGENANRGKPATALTAPVAINLTGQVQQRAALVKLSPASTPTPYWRGTLPELSPTSGVYCARRS